MNEESAWWRLLGRIRWVHAWTIILVLCAGVITLTKHDVVPGLWPGILAGVAYALGGVVEVNRGSERDRAQEQRDARGRRGGHSA